MNYVKKAPVLTQWFVKFYNNVFFRFNGNFFQKINIAEIERGYRVGLCPNWDVAKQNSAISNDEIIHILNSVLPYKHWQCNTAVQNYISSRFYTFDNASQQSAEELNKLGFDAVYVTPNIGPNRINITGAAATRFAKKHINQENFKKQPKMIAGLFYKLNNYYLTQEKSK